MAAEPKTLRDELIVRIPYAFDFRAPDYVSVVRWRLGFLERIRRKKGAVDDLSAFYRRNPVQFVADWGVTYDPRNIEIGLPAKIPFVPFKRQIEWMLWTLERWRARERGLTDKSRGSGASWMAVSLAASLCMFNRGFKAGFGSRKAEYVDKLGDPKSLFFKARMFIENIPPEFRFGWNARKNAREMLLTFPGDASMAGESGDSIGRGDRTSIYFVDEAAFLEHPDVAESSLSDTTNCRIDISTPPIVVSDNAFVDRRESLPAHQVFTFHFRDDPRRDAEWEAKKRRELAPEVFKREYEVSYEKSGAFFTAESLLIPALGAGGTALVKPDGSPVFGPVEMPMFVDTVFAVIDSALKTGKEHDGLAVTFGALCRSGITPFPLIVLDWDYKQIEGAMLEVWLPTVFEYLEELAAECKAIRGASGAWIEDKVSGTVLLQQAENKGWPVHAIDSKLTAMGKSERAINVSGYVHQGQVKFSRRAYERVVNYKGVTKNHLWSQVLGFRPGVQDGKQDDPLDTFTYMTALALGNSEGF